MKELERYDNQKINISGCLACELIQNPSIDKGRILETKYFTISQDFELPINGMVIIAAKRHIHSYIELDKNEKNELSEIMSNLLKILKKEICDTYSIVQEEKSHFHIWLYPNHDWMKEKFGNPVNNVKQIFEYAKNNLKTVSNLQEVENTLSMLRDKLKG